MPVAQTEQRELLDPLFQQSLSIVRQKTKKPIFETWFRNLQLLDVTDDVIRIGTPNKFVKEWLEGSDLLHTLAAAVREAFERSLTPELVLTENPLEGESEEQPAPELRSAGALPPLPHRAGEQDPLLVKGSSIQLKDDYVFENYIVGPNNRLAHAASMAVAEAPGQAYNPLFIHSAVGLGKTHLLQAICHALVGRHARAKILYLSCEDFVNRFIEAVKDGELEQFRYKYRNVDVLVIDDIHFLADKERIQEEFFHTFNTLYNAQKQIILSADCAPSEIPTLEDRLVSRFKWGLVTRIDPPEFETRAAIIKQKAEARGYRFQDDVVKFLASRIDSNIREIEGAINRLVGTASLMNRPVDLAFAQQILSDLVGTEVRRVQMADICEAVVQRFKVKLSDMQSKKRTKRIAFPRQVCMYLARELTDLTLSDIGAHFGGRDHTTVIYAIERIEERARKESDIAQMLEELKREARTPRR
ncbi:MAG: chromosomal replication initiator protein DnaA [Planctomycetota bacterium]|nr:MAG: chromosomal replication initiator protein DnaA [Planctomycetota bacterium]